MALISGASSANFLRPAVSPGEVANAQESAAAAASSARDAERRDENIRQELLAVEDDRSSSFQSRSLLSTDTVLAAQEQASVGDNRFSDRTSTAEGLQENNRLEVSEAASRPVARVDGQQRASGEVVSPTSANDGAQPDSAAEANQQTTASPASGELSEEEQQVVEELRRRDQEVRAHERAHAAVGGEFAGRPEFEFETGPDGRQYAVSGEVSIDASPVSGDPEATIDKLRAVIAAALAPAEPSGQDRAVAVQAQANLQQALAEATAQRNAPADEEGGEAATTAGLSGSFGEAQGRAAAIAALSNTRIPTPESVGEAFQGVSIFA